MTTTRTGLPAAPRRPHEALSFCYSEHASGSADWYQLCEALAHDAYGIGALYPDAWTAWTKAVGQHPCTSATVDWTRVPVGADLFYRGGDHGHVATFIGIRDGQPLCWTNDAGGHGVVSAVNPTWFEAHWAHYLVGWTEDNNGHDLGLTIDGQVAPQWQHQAPPPKDPPPVHESLLDVLQHAGGDVIRAQKVELAISRALVEAQPNRPLLRALVARQEARLAATQADWSFEHQAAT